ncbi:MAG: twin-arginine translocase subunit TatC [Paludibacteraceae bacterium]|nr:twin-arginine translocase subunit TatC [Paludibacteraceae bacterium]
MADSFWDHLDELRSVLIRCVVAWLVCAVAMFCLREPLFAIIFAPSRPDFITYRLLEQLPSFNFQLSNFNSQFINTQLAAQFTTHMEVAAVAGLIVACPFLLWQLYGFVAPALYPNEKRAARRIIGFGTLLFAAGVALNYLIIFPFAFRFLASYQVQPEVVNQIALDSYVSTLLILSLIMGVLFEMPIVAWALGKAGILEAEWLKQYRKHALVALMIIAAVITPTGDAFTLMLVTLPLYLLYELSIRMIR